MPYWRLYYHIVWATAGRHPWLVADRAALVEAALRKKTHDLGGLVHAVGVMPEHVHIAVSLPPTMSMAEMVSELKGATSFLVRRRDQRLVEQGFRWQGEYGVVSFNERILHRVVAYVLNQTTHHQSDQLWDILETDREPLGWQ